MPENNDGPFHLRFWMQTKERKMGMCYNHLPRNLPELQHRIGLSHDSPPDEIDMKDGKVVHGRQNGVEQWKAFLQQIGSGGDPMALCNMGYCYFNGARSSVGIIFVEKNIDAPAGTSTGTEIAAFVRDPRAKWDMDLKSAIDLHREGELDVGDRIIAVDGMDVTDENIYALLSADDVPGSTLTITVQNKADVEAHRQDKHHKSQPPRVFKICRSERVASKRDQVKQKAIDVWKKAAERGELAMIGGSICARSLRLCGGAGNAGAAYNLGYCYTFGVVVKQDDQIASDWFAKFHRARTAERLHFRQNQKSL